VNFTDTSTNGGSTITHALTFGDGGTSTRQNPATNTSCRTYDVQLRVANTVGPDSTTRAIHHGDDRAGRSHRELLGTPLRGCR